jgi:hypothetical protein
MTVDVHQAWTKRIRLYQYGHVIQKSSRPCGSLSILKTFRNLWKIAFLAILQPSASQVIDALVKLNNSSAILQQYLLEAGAPSPILRFHTTFSRPYETYSSIDVQDSELVQRQRTHLRHKHCVILIHICLSGDLRITTKRTPTL